MNIITFYIPYLCIDSVTSLSHVTPSHHSSQAASISFSYISLFFFFSPQNFQTDKIDCGVVDSTSTRLASGFRLISAVGCRLFACCPLPVGYSVGYSVSYWLYLGCRLVGRLAGLAWPGPTLCTTSPNIYTLTYLLTLHMYIHKVTYLTYLLTYLSYLSIYPSQSPSLAQTF